MTSKIKVDNINKVSDDSNIINKCGTTITLGASGDSIALASGASQTGFGRTGTVDWQTGSIKTGDFTSESGKGYFVNTTSGTVTATLPASPNAGDIVALKDYALTFDTNSLFINRNGSSINGGTGSTTEIKSEGATIMLVYVDGTKGWIPTQDDSSALIAVTPTFIAATGGTVTTVDTNFKVHTFTGPGTFAVSSVGNCAGSNEVSYMVIAGGGGGGGEQTNNYGSGGGGAGGFREGKTSQCSYTASPLAASGFPVTATSYAVTVGSGGAAGPSPAPNSVGTSGSTSSAFGITSAGGGGGRGGGDSLTGNNGGSGGGGSGGGSGTGGTGNTPGTSPPQGNPGGVFAGAVSSSNYIGGAGGGGGSAAGATICMPSPYSPTDGDGGAGGTTSINGTPTAFAGGGGGGVYANASSVPWAAGSGGAGGGGRGSAVNAAFSCGGAGAVAGTANTGGGGGGGSSSGPASPIPAYAGGQSGGSGVVIVRYKFQ